MKLTVQDFFDGYEEHMLDLPGDTGASVERIKELTMHKIERTPKKSRKGLAAIAVAAALILALGTAAVASGALSSWMVNWQAERVEELPAPAATPDPALLETDNTAHARDILAGAELDGCDVLVVRYEDETGAHSSATPAGRKLNSAEALEALLAEEGSELTVPVQVPAGYALRQAEVHYACAGGYAYALVTSETDENGVTTERWAIPEAGRVIRDYVLYFYNGTGDIIVRGELMEGDVDFAVADGETARQVGVAGMDGALILEKTGSTALEIKKVLETPVEYTDLSVQTGQAHPVAGGSVFGNAHYSIDATALDAEGLMAIVK